MADTAGLSKEEALRTLIQIGKCPEHLTAGELLDLDEAHRADRKEWGGIAGRLGQLLPGKIEKEQVPSLLERLPRLSFSVQKVVAQALADGELMTLEQLNEALGKIEYPAVEKALCTGLASLTGKASWEKLVAVLQCGRNQFDCRVIDAVEEEAIRKAAQASDEQLRRLDEANLSRGDLSRAAEERLSELMRELGEKELRERLKSDWDWEQEVAANLLVSRGKVTADEAVRVLQDRSEDDVVIWTYGQALPSLLVGGGKTVVDLAALLSHQVDVVRRAAAQALIMRTGEQDDVLPALVLRAAREIPCYNEALLVEVVIALKAALADVRLGELVELSSQLHGSWKELVQRELRSPKRVAELEQLVEEASVETEASAAQ